MTKQTTVVVIGSLRVNTESFHLPFQGQITQSGEFVSMIQETNNGGLLFKERIWGANY